MSFRTTLGIAIVTQCLFSFVKPAHAQFGGAVFCSNCSTSFTQGAMKVTQDLAYSPSTRTAYNRWTRRFAGGAWRRTAGWIGI
jgi:hypothetical protein